MGSQCAAGCAKSSLYIILNIFYLLGYLIFVYTLKLWELFFPRPLKSLAGEIILLTGSANGIGREIAHELANVGATLVCWDVDEVENQRLVAELKKMGAKAHAYTVDVSDKANIDAAAQKVREEIGDVTVLFNNAGIAPYSSFMKLDEKLIPKVFEVNLFALFYIIRAFVPQMIASGRGHIVSMASLNAFLPNRDQSVYASTKHAMTGFLDSFREEIRDHPQEPAIKITTVYPIFVQTGMLDGNRVEPRFPTLAPTLSPEYVAKEAVKGFRQNYEHVILPPSAQIFVILNSILPAKFVEKLQEFLMKPNPVGDYPASGGKRKTI